MVVKLNNLTIDNRTRFPSDEVARLVGLAAWFTMCLMHKPVSVLVKHSRRNRVTGMARVGGAQMVVRIPPASAFPVKGADVRMRGRLCYRLRNWREAVLSTAAHEFEHLNGLTGDRRHELACEAVALAALGWFRNLEKISNLPLRNLRNVRD